MVLLNSIFISVLFYTISALISVCSNQNSIIQQKKKKQKHFFAFSGFDDESTSMKRSFNIFNQQVSIEYRSNGSDLFEQSVTLLEPGEDLIVYLSNEWIHIENKQRQEQKLTIYLNETNFFFSTENRSHLLVGFNRNINGNQTGIGVCRVNLTFIECIAEQRMCQLERN